MIKVTGRWERGEPGISCPVTLVFHLIFKFQKVTKLFGRHPLCPLQKTHFSEHEVWAHVRLFPWKRPQHFYSTLS